MDAEHSLDRMGRNVSAYHITIIIMQPSNRSLNLNLNLTCTPTASMV